MNCHYSPPAINPSRGTMRAQEQLCVTRTRDLERPQLAADALKDVSKEIWTLEGSKACHYADRN